MWRLSEAVSEMRAGWAELSEGDQGDVSRHGKQPASGGSTGKALYHSQRKLQLVEAVLARSGFSSAEEEERFGVVL